MEVVIIVYLAVSSNDGVSVKEIDLRSEKSSISISSKAMVSLKFYTTLLFSFQNEKFSLTHNQFGLIFSKCLLGLIFILFTYEFQCMKYKMTRQMLQLMTMQL